jgi:hypothetical protein
VPRSGKDNGAEWLHLIARLNESAFVAEHYSELVEPPRGAARWTDDFNFVATAAVTLNDRSGVVGYWTMHGDGADRLARRLARDVAFLDRLARACFGLSAEELRERLKPAMTEAISQPGRTILVPGNRWGISDAIYNLPDPPEGPVDGS